MSKRSRETNELVQRIVAALLSVALVLTGLPTAALAEALEEVGGDTEALEAVEGDEDERLLAAKAAVSIDAARVILSPSAAAYDGTQKNPSVDVVISTARIGNSLPDAVSSEGVTFLKEGKHFEVTAPEGRIEPGTYDYIITGIGRCTGTITATFTIRPKAISKCTATLSENSFVYDGTMKHSSITVMDGDKTLVEGIDYEVTVPDGRTDVGTYKYTVTGKGNYNGTKTVSLAVTAKPISECDVTLVPSSYIFDNTVKTPDVIVEDGEKTLVQGTDYTISLPIGRKNPATYSITVRGKGNYSGNTSASFTIARDISTCNVTLSQDSYEYDGTQKNPTVTVKNGSTKLSEGTHYTLSTPSGRIDAGAYTYVVTGIGTYTGTNSAILTIKGRSVIPTLSLSPESFTYNGSVQKPAVTVKDGSTVLENGTDYDLAWPSDCTNAGSYTVTATLKGSRTGTGTATYTIARADVSAATIASIADQVYTGSAITPTPSVTLSGRSLTLGTDYTLSYSDNTSVGTATVTVLGRGNYTGSKSKTFHIVNNTFSVTLSPSSYTYNGSQKYPTVTVKDGSTTLVEGTHYTISIPSGRTNAGTYTYTISGKNGYTGTKTVTLTIHQASPTLSFANSSVSKKTGDGTFTNALTKVTDGNVTFSSSNTSVATVNSSSGLVAIKGAGSATITASASAGTNYSAGSASYTLTVSQATKDIASCTVTLSPSSYTYDGRQKSPTVMVKDGSTTLTAGTHYTLSTPGGRTNAGTYTYTASGTGNYTGTKEVTLTISKATPALTFASSSVGKKTTDGTFTNALTKVTDGTVTFSSSDTSVATVNSSSGLVTVKGVGSAAITASATEGTNYSAGSVSYTLTVSAPSTYAVSYDANGGTGAPSSQTKQENVALTLSNAKPSKVYTIGYNANGGSVSPASKSVSCTFKGWNTAKGGTGTSYSPGGSYTANASATLYAQWENPTAGTLATPTRSGYSFQGWYTAASGGEQVTASSVVDGGGTLYAHWYDPYNLKDETYSFTNYGDEHGESHCFGMSMTSAGYHNGYIDISLIGGNANTPLYSFKGTPLVKSVICKYSQIQGNSARAAIVAGGSFDLRGQFKLESDWTAVVNYVKNHEYDDAGLLELGFWKDGREVDGSVKGHSVNFLRYQNVNGQDRVYAYDNNFPNEETYFYQDAKGSICQTPKRTFDTIDSIELSSVETYFKYANHFDATRAVYMDKNAAKVEGFAYSVMKGDDLYDDCVMYEMPEDVRRITIIPNEDNASFIYMDHEYRFGDVTSNTRGELRLISKDDAMSDAADAFTIYEESSTDWSRVWGNNALDTMKAIAGEFGSASVAVVTTNADFKDALAASCLAGQSSALVLTTPKGSAATQTKNALKAAGVKTVYVVGSTADITDATMNALKSGTGVTKVERIGGSSASAKAVAVVKKCGKRSDTVIIATQASFKDALSIAPYSYATKSPILYAETNKKLSDATLSYIKSAGYTKAIIVGGPVALPASIDSQLTSKTKIKAANISRLAGNNSYETSLLIAQWATGGKANGNYGTYQGKALAYVKFQPSVLMSADNLAVATGQGWKDALCGAALVGKNKSVLLLADDTGGNHYAKATSFCKSKKTAIAKAYVLGGTVAVSGTVWDALLASTAV